MDTVITPKRTHMNAYETVQHYFDRAADQLDLHDLIEAAGGRALRLPGIAIRPTQDPAEAARLLAADWDLLIFVSRNAVEHGLPLFPAGRLPAAATVAAVRGLHG